MTTIVSCIRLKGMERYQVQVQVEVEVQLMPSIDGVSIIGLPNAAIKESKVRVRTALYANDCRIVNQKVVIHLSPAEEKKNSPFFDLAMAVGIMKESGKFSDDLPDKTAYLGVLSLDGTMKPVDGILPAVIAARQLGYKILYLPPIANNPFMDLKGLKFRYVQTIQNVLSSLSGQLHIFSPLETTSSTTQINFSPKYDRNFGHQKAKRALEIAAAGRHNVLMIGPPGSGKSLLAEIFPSILPSLSPEESLEVRSIYQLTALSLFHNHLPPFREPHHSASAISLIGGGAYPKPGEISLAHHGVLLDEMAEFTKKTLDMIRQPMETGKITIGRTSATVTYPAQFILLAAMNPCSWWLFGF